MSVLWIRVILWKEQVRIFLTWDTASDVYLG
jgi:hypothetical protein